MVDDRITDGKRIAQLLASEVTGLETPPLDRVAVVDAEPDASPSPDGSFAYSVAVDGERIGAVTVRETSASLTIESNGPVSGLEELSRAIKASHGGDLSAEGGDGLVITIESGGRVKDAADVLVEAVDPTR